MLAFDLLKLVHRSGMTALALLLCCIPQVEDGGNVNGNGGIEDLCGTEPAPTPTGEILTLDLGGGVTMELVRIPAGAFMMGTDSTDFWLLDRCRPVHCVTLGLDFYIGRYEVTQEQWEAVTGMTLREHADRKIAGFDPTRPGSVLKGEGPNYPMYYVSWGEAVEFCERLSGMSGYEIGLPTEAEWEYACRAGTVTEFSFGDDEGEFDEHAWYADNSGSRTHEVGTKLPNAWTLYDMHGNVWEWCEDFWHEDYAGAPSDGSAWMTGGDPTYRILRGGSWANSPPYCRSAFRMRGNWPGDSFYGHIGFRVAAGSQLSAPE